MTPILAPINTVYSIRQIRVRPVSQLQRNQVDVILKGGTKIILKIYIFRKLHRAKLIGT